MRKYGRDILDIKKLLLYNISVRYPLLITPAYKDYLWGGPSLKTKWGKETELNPLAEAWELSLRPDAPSRVANGGFAGMTLLELSQKYPELFGEKCAAFSEFPTLVKLIDSKQNLSIQVHPSDEYALKNENSYGKSEVWLILEAEKGAGIYFGFKEQATAEQAAEYVKRGAFTDLLNFIPVKAGDVFMVEAGIVHAIGAGITLLEIQQNSDLTYRVYDFGRLDKFGKPRELHLEKALAVMNFKPSPKKSLSSKFESCGAGVKKRLIADNKYFHAEYYISESSCRLLKEDCFISLTFTASSAELYFGGECLRVLKGNTVFVPAGLAVEIKGGTEFAAVTL